MDIKLDKSNIIGQYVLRSLEALCIQEEPPACAAACPLHVDVRELTRLVEAQNFADAFKLYAKAVPFARLVAHTCPAPCEGMCKRAALGGAIQIGALERAVSRLAGASAKPPLLLPKKSGKVAVAGGGLRGMAAANDLARKGYAVTIFEKTGGLGGRLHALPESVLPAGLLGEEIAALLALPIAVRYDVEVPLADAGKAAAFLLDGFDAAFVACTSPLDGEADGATLLVNGQTSLQAGRRAGRMVDGAASVYDVFDGRSAATTIDRLLQKVSIAAGREKEGSYETALYTNLAGITPAPPAQEAPGGYTAGEAAAEAARCIRCECMECVKKCGFLQHYKTYPRKTVREVYNNLSIAMGEHHANGMINTCALCGQCAAVCPNGLDVAAVMEAARKRMVHSKKMPPSAHEFALLDMAYSLSGAFNLARHPPGFAASEAVFFPGCQLAASEPALVRAVYDDLCARMEGGVGLWLACCGVMARWAGDEARFEQVKAMLREQWGQLGSPKVIAGCPTCAATLRGQMDIPAESLFDTLNGLGVCANGENGAAREMVLHHACGARHDTAARQSAAELAAACGAAVAAGTEQQQMESPCCGYGGLAPFVNTDVAAELTGAALSQLMGGEEAGGNGPPVLTYCVNCRDRYLAAGREAFHLLELCYPGTPGLNHKNPTFSRRQENRANTKRRMLADLWGETIGAPEHMTLLIDGTLEAKLEDGHILHSDIEAAIRRAEAEEEKLLDPKTGHFTTSHRPGNVTFWVEYTPEGTGYRVFNAYCHRMLAVLTDKLTESGAGG